jgi:hypothetical protein
VEHDALECLPALRRDEQPSRRPAGGECLLDRAPAGNQLLPFLELGRRRGPVGGRIGRIEPRRWPIEARRWPIRAL